MGIITDREELIVGKMMSEKNERKYFDEYRQMLQIAEEYDCIDVCCAVREITEKAKIYLEDDGKYGLAYIPKEDEKVVLYDWYEFLGSLTITEEKNEIMDVAEVDARLMRIDAGKKAVGRLEKVLKEFGIVSPDLTNRTNWDRVKLFTFLYRFSVEKDHGI